MSGTITFDRARLALALDTAGKVRPWTRAADKQPLVRISTSNGRAVVTSADPDVQIDVGLTYEGDDVTIFVPLTALSGIVTKASAGVTITMTDEAGTVTVRAGRMRASLSGAAIDALPDRAAVFGAVSRISASALRAGIDTVAPAAGKSVIDQPYLGGIYLHEAAGGAAFAAQDGNRIHAAAQDGNRIGATALIPHRTAQLLAAVLSEDGEAEVIVGERGIRVSAGTIVVTASLLTAPFPSVEQKMRSPTDRTLSARASELLADIEVVMTVANLRDRDFRLDLGPVCEVSAFRTGNSGFEAGALQLDVEYVGKPLAIGFQFPLVRDALALFGDAPVLWRFGGPADPSLITAPTHPGVEALVSPFVLAPDHLRLAA